MISQFRIFTFFCKCFERSKQLYRGCLFDMFGCDKFFHAVSAIPLLQQCRTKHRLFSTQYVFSFFENHIRNLSFRVCWITIALRILCKLIPPSKISFSISSQILPLLSVSLNDSRENSSGKVSRFNP